MKKSVLAFSLLFIVLLMLGCSKSEPKDFSEYKPKVTGNHVQMLEESLCSSAEKHDSCGKELADLGVIAAQDCCKRYGKCC